MPPFAVRFTILTRCLAAAAMALLGPALFAASAIALLEPKDGTVLRGGSVAMITWTATATLPRDAEEWEAFLSVDGGAYYASRITPHLDIDIRSFEWRVPNVSSKSVRLLIRVGNERDESTFELPLRFSIEATPPMGFSFAPPAKSRGESARPGDPSVVEWASGDRQGHQVVEERAGVSERIRTKAVRPGSPRHAFRRSGVVTPRVAKSAATSLVLATPAVRFSSPPRSRDILLLVRRRNI